MSQHKPSFRILLVSPRPEQTEKIQAHLARHDYETILADHQQAPDLFNQTHPDGAIIEVGTALAESLAVCRHLRLQGGTAFPILVVTPDENLMQAPNPLSQYADDYLLEPIDQETLLLRFSVLLKRKQVPPVNVEGEEDVCYPAPDVNDFLGLMDAVRAALDAGQSGAIALIGARLPNDSPSDSPIAKVFSPTPDQEQEAEHQRILAQIADFLRPRLKRQGASALVPYGSFSFVTYQPHSTALALVDRLNAWRDEYRALGQGDLVAGVAAFPGDAANLLDLMTVADDALLQARHQRGVTLYRPTLSTDTAHRHRRLMIVDDSEEQVEMLDLLVTQEGYETLRAYNGEQALDVLSKQQPDLLLLDLVMPRLDGFAVMHRLRDRNGGRLQPPVIMITANDCEESVLRGFELGARDYIIKPYHPRELLSRIHSILEPPVSSQ